MARPADAQFFGRAPGDAGEQGLAAGLQPDQHVARGIGGGEIDDDGADAVEDAALPLRNEGQADVAGMNAAAQHAIDRLGALRNENCPAGKFEAGQLVGLMGGDADVDDDAGIVGKGGRQVDAAQDCVEGAAGHHPTLVEQHQMVGQAGDFIGAWLT